MHFAHTVLAFVLTAGLLPGADMSTTVSTSAPGPGPATPIPAPATSAASPAAPTAIPATPTLLLAPRAGGWRWPMHPTPQVVGPFRRPATTWASGHRGVDLVGTDIVRAPQSGVVSFVGVIAGRPVLVVAHPGGLRSTFEPVAATVAVGAAVAAGDPIGLLVPAPGGHCGEVVCLHWGVLRGQVYLDPLALLAGRVVLLPLG